MKKLLSILLVVSMISAPAFTSANNDIIITVDGAAVDFDTPPQIIEGRTMVPMRAIFETLGADVDWDSDSQTVTAYKNGVLLSFTIGSTTLYHNSIEQSVDVPAQIVDGRTLIPVRVISECLGADVDWDSENNTVNITSTDRIQYINWNDEYEYWGEVENYKANGYGILYSKTDNSLCEMGLYSDSKIVEGTDLYDNGDIFIGTYQDGKLYNGTYYYSDGDIYIGDFLNSQKHGTGTYFFSNGSFYDGEWQNDLPSGYGEYYHSYYDCLYVGNYINGKKDGLFTIYDNASGDTHNAEYKDDELLRSWY